MLRDENMLRKVILILLVAALLFSVGACGAKKKLNEKVAEKITEGIIEKATGGDAKVNIDEGKITVKGENDEEYSFGGGEWPKSQAADLFPQFNKGKIISVMESDEMVMVILEEVEEKDFEEYVEKLKDTGFKNDMTEISSGDDRGFYANAGEGKDVNLAYSTVNKILTITLQIDS